MRRSAVVPLLAIAGIVISGCAGVMPAGTSGPEEPAAADTAPPDPTPAAVEPSPAGVPASPTPAASRATFTGANIVFDTGKVAYTTQTVGGDWLAGYCWPSSDLAELGFGVMVVNSGGMDGSCTVKRSDTRMEGQLTGDLDDDGSIRFVLNATSHRSTGDAASYADNRIKLTGSGHLTANVATGVAEFSVGCDAHGAVNCIDAFKDLDYEGTVPFTITFSP